MKSTRHIRLFCFAITILTCCFAAPLVSGEQNNDNLNAYSQHEITMEKSESDSTMDHGNPVINSYNAATDTIINTTLFLYQDVKYLVSAPARINKKSALWLGSILSISGLLYAYDEDILAGFARSRENTVYKTILDVGDFFEPAGLTRNTHPYYLAGYAAGYLFKWEPLQEASLQLLESMLIEGFTRVKIINKLTGRAKPYTNRGAYYFKFNGDRSLPSGHTSNIFQLATVLSHHVNHWAFTVASFGIATTVGFQRLHIRSHWPSDVLLGAVYGTAISRAIIKLHENRKIKVIPKASLNQGSLLLGFTYQF